MAMVLWASIIDYAQPACKQELATVALRELVQTKGGS